MELEGIEKQKKIEELRNKLELRIRWKNGDKIVFASRSNTLYQLFEIIWHQFQLFNEDDFQSYELDVIQDKKNEKNTEVITMNEVENKLEKSRENYSCSEGKNKDNDIDDNKHFVNNDTSGNKNEDESKNENVEIKMSDDDDDDKVDLNKIIKTFSDEDKPEKSLNKDKKMESIGPESSSESHPVALTVTNYSKIQKIILFSPEIADNMRLRLYNASAKTASDAFDVTSILKTLESLNFNSYRPLILETKKSSSVFDVYHVDGFNILLEEFDLELNEFKEIRSVRMAKLGTLTDLKSKNINMYMNTNLNISINFIIDIDINLNMMKDVLNSTEVSSIYHCPSVFLSTLKSTLT